MLALHELISFLRGRRYGGVEAGRGADSGTLCVKGGRPEPRQDGDVQLCTSGKGCAVKGFQRPRCAGLGAFGPVVAQLHVNLPADVMHHSSTLIVLSYFM